ncbi:MAG TPA: hypothetical protein ENJ65_02795 [Candidatus Tenderia electrophaga]|uniref:LPP20 lipoprotein n=1 Tax=Candidatus Tenderia electrophaga TaxID=1748243 RepID=A0A832N510_9GAMM|nr:hypothetical protein [Candidatus Tenderia electrophaga]
MANNIAVTALATAMLCTGCVSTPATESSQPATPTSHAAEQAIAQPAAIVSGPPPVWIDSESKKYPRVDYITSRTQAETAEQASQQALANVSRYFLIDTSKYEMPVEQAIVGAGYEINTTNLPDSALTVASPEVKRVLQKLKIVDTWFDSANKRYHALAALPRNAGRGYLDKQIKALDAKTQEYMQAARSNPDPFIQAGKIAMAWRCQQLRGEMQKAMRVADLTGRGIAAKYKLSLLRNDAINLITTLQIQPSGLAGEMNAAEVTNMIRGGLNTAGLHPTDINPDYLMSGTLKASIIGERNGWAVGRGELKLVLTDKVTGEVRGTKTWQIEVPGLDENAAIRRVYEKTVYKLKKDMRDILIEMAMQ